MSSGAPDSTRLIEMVAWVEENKKPILIGVAAVAVLISALAIHRWNRNQAEIKAGAALFGLEKPFERGAESKGPAAQAYLELATTYRGTSAGAQATLLGAEVLFKEGKYAEAKTRFESFLQGNPNHSLAALAVFGVAASQDALGKTNEALAAYQDVVTRYPNSAVFGQAKLSIASLYEARNEPAQALKIYEELTRAAPPTVWGSDAARRREQLLAQHPELAKTNTPTATLPGASPSNVVQLLPTNPPAAPTTNP